MHDPTRVEVPLAQRPGHVNPLNRPNDNVTVIMGQAHGGFAEVVMVISDAGCAQQVLHKLNAYNVTRPCTYVDEHTTQLEIQTNTQKLAEWARLHPGGSRAARYTSFTLSLHPVLSPTELRTMDLMP